MSENKPLTDSEFIEAVTMIAANYGCLVTNIDLEQRIIEIVGPNEVEASIAIGDYMQATHGISEVNPEEPDIKIVKDGLGWAI